MVSVICINVHTAPLRGLDVSAPLAVCVRPLYVMLIRGMWEVQSG